MHRLFDPNLTSATVPGMKYVNHGSEAHHAVRVKHLQCRAIVEILNGQGLRAQGTVSALDRKQGILTIEINTVEQFPRPASGVIVASAVPKGSHVDVMVNQLSQLGVQRWLPLICRHSAVKPRRDGGKIKKWQRLTIESAKQCGRAYLMEIGEPRAFADVLTILAECSERVFIADQHGESARTLFLAAGTEIAKNTLGILIGPEGGFAEEEYELADQIAQAHHLSLGPHTLRIETAAVAAATTLIMMISQIN